MKPPLRTIASQPSWILQSADAQAAITQLGGHLAPVTFFTDSDKPIQPYWISPWQDEEVSFEDKWGCMAPCRGDFFCMPFGANVEEVRGEDHPGHGESASRKWTFKDLATDGKRHHLRLEMQTRVRKGRIVKDTYLVDRQPAVYQQNVLEGYSGSMPVGNHHTLAMPEEHPESVLVASSPIEFGMTNDGVFSNPALGEYQSLAVGETFKSLSRVPTLWKKPATTDCSKYPTRRGFADLLQINQKPTGDEPAWVTATYTAGGYLWFSFKDIATLPSTVFWIENHGRWSKPWHGRNCCLGLENVCAHFADGLARATRANKLNRAGIPTALKLDPKTPTAVRVIQGVARAPKGFGKVDKVDFAPGKATFISGKKRASIDVTWEFLQTGEVS